MIIRELRKASSFSRRHPNYLIFNALLGYVSENKTALHGMSTKQRMVMFNQIPFMVGWLGELSNVAEGVCQFLEAVKEKNRIPSNPQSEEK